MNLSSFWGAHAPSRVPTGALAGRRMISRRTARRPRLAASQAGTKVWEAFEWSTRKLHGAASQGRLALQGFVALSVCFLIFGCSSQRAEVAAAPNIPEGSQLYDVFLAKHGGSQKKIGQVTADKEYRLNIVSVIPGQKDFLTETIDVMNAKPNLHAEAAPPQGAPRFSEFSQVVDRNSPAFFPQLQTHLKQYYDLILQPASK